MRKIRMLMVDGKTELVAEIPEDAAVTFGPSVPGTPKLHGTPWEYAVRIYKGKKDNLLAVFTGVRMIFDADLKITKKVSDFCASAEMFEEDDHGDLVSVSPQMNTCDTTAVISAVPYGPPPQQPGRKRGRIVNGGF